MSQNAKGANVNRNPYDLKGKNALITGSSRGLGKMFARALLTAGARVFLNGRDKNTLDESCAELKADGYPHVFATVFDVTKEDQVEQALNDLQDQHGSVHILVNNAGIQHRASLEQFPEDAWRKIMDINLTGPFLVAKHVARQMIKDGGGKIINICSLQSELGRPTIAPYAASKGGLQMLTRGMATDWARYNIQVNAIAPGYFITEMTRPLADDPVFDGWLKKRTPANRWGDPEELTGALMLFASDASSFINGQTLFVDGGIKASV